MTASIDDVLGRMDALLPPMQARGDELAYFLATYRRITEAVKARIERRQFDDPEWVERVDVAFASEYLGAIESWQRGDEPPGPWRVACEASLDHDLPPLRHVLLAMNAHVNFDLPKALLATITSEEFDDAALIDARARDHHRIDEVLASRVAAEDEELKKVEQPGDRTLLDRMLTPFNQAGTKRFLREARGKVWRNVRVLDRARRTSPSAFDARLQELGDLAARRVDDLREPGLVLLKLTRRGFGVLLPDA